MGPAAQLQCVREQFDPDLSPKYLAVGRPLPGLAQVRLSAFAVRRPVPAYPTQQQ